MKAISIRQPWASMIASRQKTIETRSWGTTYRGPLLIVASKRPLIKGPGSVYLPTGVAVCRCKLINCRPMRKEDEAASCCETYPGAYAWVLGSIQITHGFHVKGRLGLFDVDVTF